MQLKDLFKPLGELTDDELREHVRQIRNNRTVVRPAAKAHAKRAASKGTTTKMNKLHAMLAAMSDSDKAQLLLELGMSDEQGG